MARFVVNPVHPSRTILKGYGPSIAKPKGEGNLSLAYIAIAVLNTVIRPVLAKWHPLLIDFEHSKEPLNSILDHEQKWHQADELRGILNGVRLILIEYSNLLAEVAGVPSLSHSVNQMQQ